MPETADTTATAGGRTGRCPVVHFDHNSVGARRRPRGVVPQAARRGAGRLVRRARRLLDPLGLQAGLRGGPRRRHLLLRAQQPRRRGAVGRHPEDAGAVPHPDRDRPAELPQVAQADQPDHRSGRRGADGEDRQALRHQVHRRHHRDRRGRHDLGHRRPGDRHRRLARAADRALGALRLGVPRAARRGARHAGVRAGGQGRHALPRGGHPRHHRRAPGQPLGRHHQLPRRHGGRRPAGHRRRGLRDGRPAALGRRRHHRVAGQQHRGVAVRAPGRAPGPRRPPGDDGPGDRGVPALLLPHPGAGPHGHQGHRVPGLPDEGGRPGAALVGLGQPRRRALRGRPTSSTSSAGPTGTRRSASACTAAPARTSAARWPRSCSARSSTGWATTSSTASKLVRYPHQGTNNGWTEIPATFTPGPRLLPADAKAPSESY